MPEIKGWAEVQKKLELRAKQEHLAMVMSVLKVLNGCTYSVCDLVLEEVVSIMNLQFERKKKELGLGQENGITEAEG